MTFWNPTEEDLEGDDVQALWRMEFDVLVTQGVVSDLERDFVRRRTVR